MKKMRQILAAAGTAVMMTGAALMLPAPASAATSTGFATQRVVIWTWASGNRTYSWCGWWWWYCRPVATQPVPTPSAPSQPAPAPQPVPVPQPAPAPQPAPTPQPTPAPQPVQTQPAPAPAGALTAEEQQMVDLVNGARQNAGLKALTVDPGLEKVATVKAQDMVTHNYFSHTSPTYGSPFDMMHQFGVTYSTAGENIAGNQSVGAAFTALMNSPGHRANILNPSFTRIGIGIVHGSQYGEIFVQDFAG